MTLKDEYKNNSNVIRNALVRLMDYEDGSMETDGLPTDIDVLSLLPKLNGHIIVSFRQNLKLEKKINKLESEFYKAIVHKSTFIHRGIISITYLLEDSMDEIQAFTQKINGFEELSQFRYYINDIEED